jgi:predicted metal-binding membrane protein
VSAAAGGPLEALLRRERIVVASALALLTLLAWIYLLRGAGTGMSALDMTSLSLFPHLRHGGMAMPTASAWSASTWAIVGAMWWVMMVAMMTPSAAPFVLLYGRVLRHAGIGSGGSGVAPAAFLAAGYLAAWLAFSVAATIAQFLLHHAGLVSAVTMGSQSAPFSAALLIGAGLYQLSPLKQACLRHCRGPADFLTRHSRRRRGGAFRLGILHGAYCVGCCWVLMALLFVGGAMNLAWIALLTILVVLEKIAPGGRTIGWLTGGALLVWGAATLLV